MWSWLEMVRSFSYGPSVVHNLLVRELHAAATRRYDDLDARITKQIHKARAISGPKKVVKRRSTTSPRSKLGFKKLNGIHQTNGLHCSIVSSKPLDVYDGQLCFQEKGGDNGSNKAKSITFAEINSTAEVAFCFDIVSHRGLAKDKDFYDPPQTPAATAEYCGNERSGSQISWHRAMIRISNTANAFLEVLSLENGKVTATISTEDLRWLRGPGKAPFASVSELANGNIVIVMSKSSHAKEIVYDSLLLKHPPTRIESRVQVLGTARHIKQGSLENVEIFGDFMIGTCQGKDWQKIVVYDLEQVLANAEYKDDGVGQWSIPAHIVKEFPKPIFEAFAKHGVLMFNPLLMPAYYIVKADNGFHIYEVTRTENKFIEAIIPDGPMEERVRISFMRSSDIEDRLALVEEHSFSIFALTRCDAGTKVCRKIFHKNFALDEEEVAENRNSSEAIGKARGLRKKKPVHYHEYFSIEWAENNFLKQFALVKIEENRIVCYVHDTETLQIQYCLEPYFFQPGENLEFRGIEVNFADNHIFVKVKCESQHKVYVFNLVGEAVT